VPDVQWKWPWVSRALFLSTYHEGKGEQGRRIFAEARLSYLQEQLTAERVRYDALLQKFTALRLAGAVEPPPVQPPQSAAKPDPVMQAIILKAKNNILLRNHYVAYVAEQRALRVSEEDIAAAIMLGHSDDNEGVAG
jgi:hypothetical protein